MPGSLTDLESLAGEFGLGRVHDATAIPGHPHVLRLATERGVFLVRPPDADPGLYEQAALVLARAGIRQAVPLRTTAGSLVSESGLTVQEFLPGVACTSPSRTQTLATMRHVAAYHAALRAVPVPALPQSLWTRVTSADYLLAELPRLCRDDDVALLALDRLAASKPLLDALPGQLVHGDIGPDNVLLDGDDVVAIVDFTPHHQPVLFAVATAIYWYHVYGRDSLDPAVISASLAAAGPWTSAERAAWPAMLLREALRRYATPFAVSEPAEPAEPADGPASAVPSAVSPRHDALAVLTRRWSELAC
ncbi:MAG TPA: phosphotransferase [Streptosporangiaceae bacterium]